MNRESGSPGGVPGEPGGRGEKVVATALGSAFRLLARRSYTQAELRLRLERAWDQPAVTAALARLTELRLIDDEAWAERFARDRLERVGRGRRRILAELIARGVDAELAARVIGRVIDPERERDRARTLVANILGERSESDRPGAQRRPDQRELAGAFRRLVARGFPSALVRDLLGGS
ncbi:MAG: RecX family transcriptional regulator [Deltaproteobacteria bacterium]|nr:RecX family transcriptional regulator [Deltaproteobacteria bacterium]